MSENDPDKIEDNIEKDDQNKASTLFSQTDFLNIFRNFIRPGARLDSKYLHKDHKDLSEENSENILLLEASESEKRFVNFKSWLPETASFDENGDLRIQGKSINNRVLYNTAIDACFNPIGAIVSLRDWINGQVRGINGIVVWGDPINIGCRTATEQCYGSAFTN